MLLSISAFVSESTSCPQPSSLMRILSTAQRCLVAFAVLSTAAKAALNDGAHGQSPQLLKAPDDLKLLSNNVFTVLSNPAFPKHSVRIKRSDFCDGTVAYVLLARTVLHTIGPTNLTSAAHTRVTLTSKLGISFSTSSRAATIQMKTT